MTSIILIYRVVIKSSSPSSSRARNARVRETVRERENLFTSLTSFPASGEIKLDEFLYICVCTFAHRTFIKYSYGLNYRINPFYLSFA